MISKSLEEYVKAMYVLNRQNGEIRVTDVANKMNISKASVNKAVKNLKEEGMLDYEAYGDIKLTKEGEELAQKLLEAYDIGILFFRDVLGLEEEKAIENAESFKSAISDEAFNKLARYVHKELNLKDLNCLYDINNEKCRTCVKRRI
ncbi:MAG: metal-dependent transcriptional regulator [Clostridia bacterium]|nr:metal-dependent transcriptional regulator [Clostridia bacterium]